MTLTARFNAHAYTDGFESGTLTALPWTSGGNLPWQVTGDVVSFGQFAARSGAITNSQSSILSLTNFISGGGVGSFDYKVSSEEGFDFLEFYLNGFLQQRWSGEAGWATYQFAIPAGPTSLEWRYAKDAIGSAGLDAAFIDNLDLPVLAPSLRLLNPTRNGFQIQYQGPDNQSVRVEASTELTAWQTVYSTNGVNNNALIQFADPEAQNLPLRFYRAVSP